MVNNIRVVANKQQTLILDDTLIRIFVITYRPLTHSTMSTTKGEMMNATKSHPATAKSSSVMNDSSSASTLTSLDGMSHKPQRASPCATMNMNTISNLLIISPCVMKVG